MALGLGRLKLSPAAFWAMTPRELSAVLRGVFAPVHLKARRDTGSGDIELGWIRRTRFGGDSWELAEAPLNEEREAYRVEVRDGAALLRSIEVTSPQYLYTATHQQADFGGPASGFTLRVAQLSAAVGAGRALQEIVNV